MKRLSNRVNPFTHNVVTALVKDQKSTEKMNSSLAFLTAKKLLADLPLVPTGERVYELTQQLQLGLLDTVCPLEEADKHWQECLDATKNYLQAIKVWEVIP